MDNDACQDGPGPVTVLSSRDASPYCIISRLSAKYRDTGCLCLVLLHRAFRIKPLLLSSASGRKTATTRASPTHNGSRRQVLATTTHTTMVAPSMIPKSLYSKIWRRFLEKSYRILAPTRGGWWLSLGCSPNSGPVNRSPIYCSSRSLRHRQKGRHTSCQGLAHVTGFGQEDLDKRTHSKENSEILMLWDYTV